MNSKKPTRSNPKARRKICLHCHKNFTPDYRNTYHQRYCTKERCRKASKKASQKRWLTKNPGFFKGPEHVVRVQIWRQERGRGKGRMIYKLVLEFMIFRRRGRKDRVEMAKKDAKGEVLQDFCELKKAANTYVILTMGGMLQDIIALIAPRTYSFSRKSRRTGLGRRRNAGKSP